MAICLTEHLVGFSVDVNVRDSAQTLGFTAAICTIFDIIEWPKTCTSFGKNIIGKIICLHHSETRTQQMLWMTHFNSWPKNEAKIVFSI